MLEQLELGSDKQRLLFGVGLELLWRLVGLLVRQRVLGLVVGKLQLLRFVVRQLELLRLVVRNRVLVLRLFVGLGDGCGGCLHENVGVLLNAEDEARR